MTDDIVTRLRDEAETFWDVRRFRPLWVEAADEIERLRELVVLCPKCYEAEHGIGRWEQAVRGE